MFRSGMCFGVFPSILTPAFGISSNEQVSQIYTKYLMNEIKPESFSVQ